MKRYIYTFLSLLLLLAVGCDVEKGVTVEPKPFKKDIIVTLSTTPIREKTKPNTGFHIIEVRHFEIQLRHIPMFAAPSKTVCPEKFFAVIK